MAIFGFMHCRREGAESLLGDDGGEMGRMASKMEVEMIDSIASNLLFVSTITSTDDHATCYCSRIYGSVSVRPYFGSQHVWNQNCDSNRCSWVS